MNKIFRFYRHLRQREVEETFLIVQVIAAMAGGFIGPTYVLFLLSHNLNTFQVNLVNVFFMSSLFLLQTPTGAVADILGRKFSVTAGQLFWALGAFVYFLSTSFWGFVGGEILAATGKSFMTGAFEAWLFDHLASQKREKEYRKILSHAYKWGRLSIIPIGIVSGYIGTHVSLALPWLLAASFSLLAFVTAWFFLKPDGTLSCSLSEAPNRRGIGALLSVTKDSLKIILKKPIIIGLIAAWTILTFGVQAFNMYWAIIFKDTFGQQYLGIIFSILMVAIAMGYAAASHEKLDKNHPLANLSLVVAIIGIPMLVGSLFPFAFLILPAFLLHEIGRGAFDPIFSDYINTFIPSGLRATVNSLGAAFSKFGSIAGLLVSGFISVQTSPLFTWKISSVTILLILPILFVLFKKHPHLQ